MTDDAALDRSEAEYCRRVIESCDKHDEIGPLEDGYQYFWIKDRGAMSAHALRIIANELDRRNNPHDDDIAAYFAAKLPPENL